MEWGLWSATLVALALALVVWRDTLHRRAVSVPAIWSIARASDRPTGDSLAVLAQRVIGGDVFRLDRKPSDVAYGQRADTQVVQASAVRRPALSVAGLVGGPPWAALLDGIPGHDASLVVHQGDSVAGLRVRRIAPNGVIVTGMDTTWRLLVKRGWQ